MNIPEEAIAAGVDALDETGVLEGTGLVEDVVRLVAGATAPLIAAQVLRPVADAYTELLRREMENCGHGRSGHLDEQDLKLLFDALYPKWSAPLSENGRERSPAGGEVDR